MILSMNKKKSFPTFLFHAYAILPLIVFLFAASINITYAAEYILLPERTVIHKGEQISVDVLLDTKGANINAISGRLVFESNLLKLDSLSTANTILKQWVEAPRVISESDKKIGTLIQENKSYIQWSGIIPGGFDGLQSAFYKGTKPGNVLRVNFTVLSDAPAVLSFSNTEAYANDGKATNVPVENNNLVIQVVPGNPSVISPKIQRKNIQKNIVSNPKTLDIFAEVKQSEIVVNNKWFLIFSSATTTTNIDHYEVVESKSKNPDEISDYLWRKTGSPYVLSDQNRNSYIFVRAVDIFGNSYVKMIYPDSFATAHSSSGTIEILVFLFGVLVIYSYAKRGKNKKS